MGRRGATRTCRANPKRGVAKTLEAGKEWRATAVSGHRFAPLRRLHVRQHRGCQAGFAERPRLRLVSFGLLGRIFCGPEDAKLALQNVHGYDWFPSVFWAASFADSQMKGSSCIPKKIYGPGNLRCPPHQSSTAPSGAYPADCNTFC